MTRDDLHSIQRAVTTRRTFLEGLAVAGALTGVGTTWPMRTASGNTGPAPLRGTEFDLVVGATAANITGRPAVATTVNGAVPGPVLHWREGDTVTLRVRNDLAVDTSIHWHGILLPAEMDGVPGLSFHGIPPGESFTYRFDVRQNGTYWYHAHSGFQEQTGVYGAIVIEPREREPFVYDREHVVLLSDWSDQDPFDLYRLLKRQPGYFNYNDRTLGDFVRDSKRDGFRPALEERLAWLRMRMKPSDLADIGGYAYTYLMNGAPPAANWSAAFERGERVRLRIINGSAMSAFDVRIPGLEMTVVAADGQYVRPVEVDEFRLGVAEVLDVLVEPTVAEAYTIFAQSVDRAGYARGSLAVRPGLSADVPQLDEVAYLTIADMGHAGGHATGASDRLAQRTPVPVTTEHVHGSSPASPTAAANASHAEHAEQAQHDMSAMSHGAAAAMQAHPASETRNPNVDMQTMAPTARLDDPGVGLRDNGRRVLTYADLESAFADPDGRPPERTIELHLTGHMERFMWSFDGVTFSGSEPILLRYGERVRFVLVNDTMMEHPIHLHGLWSDLEDEAGEFHVRKHTVSVPPGTRRSFRVTANAPGRWALHCHLLYHMTAGMMREVRVGEPEESGHAHAAHGQG